MTVLVIKHGALGDIVLSLPLLRAIRRHHADQRLVLLTTPPFVDLLRASALFDEIWTDERAGFRQPWKALAVLRRIRGAGCERIYDLQGSRRTRLYYRLIGAPAEAWVGNARGCRHFIPDPVEPIHVFELRRRQLALVGIDVEGGVNLDFLRSDLSGFSLPRRFVLLVPGGSAHRPAKRWPQERYADLARIVAARGQVPVLIGGAAEARTIAAIKANCPQALSLLGRTSLADLASLARGAEGAVGNDTGPMHIIAAAGCPAVVLYSAESDPRLVAPRGPSVATLQQSDLLDLQLAAVLAELDDTIGQSPRTHQA